MEAEIIAIGTELTRGIISDKDGSIVASMLTNSGVHVSGIRMVPDDGTIKDALSDAVDRADLVVITGGLGPTSDDMTRKAVAEVCHAPLVLNEECLKFVSEKVGALMNEANKGQAYFPEGFDTIINNNGTAWGFCGRYGGALIVSLPGPPKELTPMMYDSVIPLIERILDKREEERDEYSSFITSEAVLEELCEEADPELIWATRVREYGISLYVSGKDREARDRAVENIMRKVGLGRIVKGYADPLSIIISTLKKNGGTLSVAESCTGGLLSEILTSLAGSSEFMMGGVVSYSPHAKENVLGVPHSVIEKHGTVSRECACAMAEGARIAVGSDYSVSITGVAGPDESEGKSVGTVFFGFSEKSGRAGTAELHFHSYGRESVRKRSALSALILLNEFIKGADVGRVASDWGYI